MGKNADKSKINVDSVMENLSSPLHCKLHQFGINGDIYENYYGLSTKICVLDSGVPSHKYINVKEKINLTSEKELDYIGHSALVCGIISAKGESFNGLTYDADLFIAKVVDKSGSVKYSNIIAGILWAIIKKVDVIYLPFSSEVDNYTLESVIAKAHSNNIVVVASTGNNNKVEFPASYPNVLSVGSINIDRNLATFSSSGIVNTLGVGIQTTYKDNKFCVSSGTSISGAVVSALCLKIINYKRVNNTSYSVDDIIKEVKKITQ